MKNLVLAVIIAVVLMNCFGAMLGNVFDMHILMHDNLLEPLESFAVLSILGAIVALVGFIVAVSLFGALFLTLACVVGVLLVAGVSVFWPFLLILFVVYLATKSKSSSVS